MVRKSLQETRELPKAKAIADVLIIFFIYYFQFWIALECEIKAECRCAVSDNVRGRCSEKRALVERTDFRIIAAILCECIEVPDVEIDSCVLQESFLRPFLREVVAQGHVRIRR